MTTSEELFKIGKNTNILLKGVSGMFGKEWVIRQVKGETYVSRAPRKPTSESEQQQCNRRRFQLATAYAKRELQDPVRKAFFMEIARKSGLTNAYTAAIKVFMSDGETAIRVAPLGKKARATPAVEPGKGSKPARKVLWHRLGIENRQPGRRAIVSRHSFTLEQTTGRVCAGRIYALTADDPDGEAMCARIRAPSACCHSFARRRTGAS